MCLGHLIGGIPLVQICVLHLVYCISVTVVGGFYSFYQCILQQLSKLKVEDLCFMVKVHQITVFTQNIQTGRPE